MYSMFGMWGMQRLDNKQKSYPQLRGCRMYNQHKPSMHWTEPCIQRLVTQNGWRRLYIYLSCMTLEKQASNQELKFMSV